MVDLVFDFEGPAAPSVIGVLDDDASLEDCSWGDRCCCSGSVFCCCCCCCCNCPSDCECNDISVSLVLISLSISAAMVVDGNTAGVAGAPTSATLLSSSASSAARSDVRDEDVDRKPRRPREESRGRRGPWRLRERDSDLMRLMPVCMGFEAGK